jgi:hypothetical protein
MLPAFEGSTGFNVSRKEIENRREVKIEYCGTESDRYLQLPLHHELARAAGVVRLFRCHARGSVSSTHNSGSTRFSANAVT